MKEHTIDLRWSLWQRLPSEDFPEAVIADMEEAFKGEGEEVTVRTAPKKEIRFGQVVVFEGGADVVFDFEWDEPYEQLWRIEETTGELTEAQSEDLSGRIASWMSEMDWNIHREIEATTFEELMEKIDMTEEDLMELEDNQSKAFDEYLKHLATSVKEEQGA